MTKRKIINCFDRLELLVGNRTPAHGSEAPFLVGLLEAIQEEKRIATVLLEAEGLRDGYIQLWVFLNEAIKTGRIKPTPSEAEWFYCDQVITAEDLVEALAGSS